MGGDADMGGDPGTEGDPDIGSGAEGNAGPLSCIGELSRDLWPAPGVLSCFDCGLPDGTISVLGS